MFISLGVDTYVDDPISDFKLSHSSYTVIGQVIADLRRPTLFVMEGYAHGA
jgi:acetoin utilization deacetylase AcuC-like enzyme